MGVKNILAHTGRFYFIPSFPYGYNRQCQAKKGVKNIQAHTGRFCFIIATPYGYKRLYQAKVVVKGILSILT